MQLRTLIVSIIWFNLREKVRNFISGESNYHFSVLALSDSSLQAVISRGLVVLSPCTACGPAVLSPRKACSLIAHRLVSSLWLRRDQAWGGVTVAPDGLLDSSLRPTLGPALQATGGYKRTIFSQNRQSVIIFSSSSPRSIEISGPANVFYASQRIFASANVFSRPASVFLLQLTYFMPANV